MARKYRPEWTFLCVEGRMSATEWRDSGGDVAAMPNVWWLQNQQDVRPIYRRTSALLFPSFWLEASGRAIPEAQLGHIPVLATRRGGIPDQLNGGGFLFDVPPGSANDYRRVPTEVDVQPWFDTLCALMEDDAAYDDAVRRAADAGVVFHPDRAKPDLVALFRRMTEGRQTAGSER